MGLKQKAMNKPMISATQFQAVFSTAFPPRYDN